MSGGKARGKDREFQVLCQCVIQQLRHQEHLVPYSGDGIDVPIECGGTTVTFDIALVSPDCRVVVVECKRWSDPVNQGAMFEFWGKVEHLRRALSTDVSGIFMAKTGFQSGAENSAVDRQGLGIEIAICDDQPPPNYDIIFRRYDPEREAVVSRLLAQRSSISTIVHTATVEFKLTHGTTASQAEVDLGEPPNPALQRTPHGGEQDRGDSETRNQPNSFPDLQGRRR